MGKRKKTKPKKGLVFTRRPGEKVLIEYGDELLTLEVTEVRGRETRLRFTGPKSFRVNRPEIGDRKFLERAAKRIAAGEIPPELEKPSVYVADRPSMPATVAKHVQGAPVIVRRRGKPT